LQDAPISKDFTKEEIHQHSLLHLLARRTQGREPLVDYSQSHVMTSIHYLSALQKKNINKVIANNVREAWVKEKEENKLRKQHMPKE